MNGDVTVPINELRSYSYCGTEQYMAVIASDLFKNSLKCCYDDPTQKRSTGGP